MVITALFHAILRFSVKRKNKLWKGRERNRGEWKERIRVLNTFEYFMSSQEFREEKRERRED